MSESTCGFCGWPVFPNDHKTWKQVTGWVGGPRKDSMRLRTDTGFYAHDECVAKQQDGQAVDQPELGDDQPTHTVPRSDEEKRVEDEMDF